MLAAGLSIDEARLVSVIAPLVATLGPVTAGPLVDYLSGGKKSAKTEVKADNNGCIRTILSMSVLLSAILYSLLLSVPSTIRLESRQTEVSFVCNDFGASLVQEKCNKQECYQFPPLKSGLLHLKTCRFDCDFPSHYGHIQSPVDIPEVAVKPLQGPATSKSFLPEDVSDLDDFFGTEPNEGDDEDDGEFGSGEESDFDLVTKRKMRSVKVQLALRSD